MCLSKESILEAEDGVSFLQANYCFKVNSLHLSASLSQRWKLFGGWFGIGAIGVLPMLMNISVLIILYLMIQHSTLSPGF